MDEIKKECSKYTYPKENYDCKELSTEIEELFDKLLKSFILRIKN